MEFAIFIFVFLLLIAPGIRMLMLARETKQIPEFFGGFYFVGAALSLSFFPPNVYLERVRRRAAVTA